MKIFALIVILGPLIFFVPVNAQDERFSNLEYGFSVQYPRELTVKTEYIDTNGIENPVVVFSGQFIGITVSVSESHGLPSEDIASRAEGVYSVDADRFEILNSDKKEIDGKEALVKEYLLEKENDTVKIRDIFVKQDDLNYRITCAAAESDFKKANVIYFEEFAKNFKIIPINDTMDQCIKGFPQRTSKEIWSSAALGDIDRDGSLEIVIGSNEGKIYVWGKNATELPGFPVKAKDYIRSSPALGDLNGDGVLEIVAGSDDGMLYAWNSTGSMLAGFPRMTADWIASSPALGDIDGDGNLEIVVGSTDTGIYAFEGNGASVCGFPIITGGNIWSSPALADLNGDGKLDVVIGSTKEENEVERLLYEAYGSEYNLYTGLVYAIDGKGSNIPGFPVRLKVPSLNDLQGSYIGYSSPAIGDLNSDGVLEIVIAAGNEVYVLTAEGKDMPGFPVKAGGWLGDSFITIGDINGDGRLEIAVGSHDGRLYVWQCNGSDLPGFPIQTGGYIRHITLGDINGDGMQEILGGSTDNRIHAWKLDGSEVVNFPKVTMDDVHTAPTLGDLEGDGSLEMIVGSDDGGIYVWRISQNYGELEWPMIRQSANHTGVISKLSV
ncbi:MAG: VCBS repeat-containing protein [Methanotrichaceae archaeon]|nr:VCBS repeat-containing protein [Methanotrichaceae archaeon]